MKPFLGGKYRHCAVAFRHCIPRDILIGWRPPASEGLREHPFAVGFLSVLCSGHIACRDTAVAKQGEGRQDSEGHGELKQIEW